MSIYENLMFFKQWNVFHNAGAKFGNTQWVNIFAYRILWSMLDIFQSLKLNKVLKLSLCFTPLFVIPFQIVQLVSSSKIS